MQVELLQQIYPKPRLGEVVENHEAIQTKETEPKGVTNKIKPINNFVYLQINEQVKS